MADTQPALAGNETLAARSGAQGASAFAGNAPFDRQISLDGNATLTGRAFSTAPVDRNKNPFADDLVFKEAPARAGSGVWGRLQNIYKSVSSSYYLNLRLIGYVMADVFSPASDMARNYIENSLKANWANKKNPWEHLVKNEYQAARQAELDNGVSRPISNDHIWAKKTFFPGLAVESYAPYETLKYQMKNPSTREMDIRKGWTDLAKEQNAKYEDLGPVGKLLSMFSRKPKLSTDLPNYANYVGSESGYYKYYGKLLISKIEAIVFTVLSTIHLIKEVGKVRTNMSEAMAAELGKDVGKVGALDIFRSNNPFIASERSRLAVQTVTRYAADATFWFGLKVGLIGEAFRTTIERAIFNKDRAPYDMLNNLVTSIQKRSAHMSDVSKENFVDEMMDLVQIVREEQKQPVIRHDALEKIRPVYDHAVRAIAEGKLTQQGALYFLGSCMDEHNPEQSMANLHRILEHGLKGIVQAKQGKLDLSAAPVAAKGLTAAAVDLTGSSSTLDTIKEPRDMAKDMGLAATPQDILPEDNLRHFRDKVGQKEKILPQKTEGMESHLARVQASVGGSEAAVARS